MFGIPLLVIILIIVLAVVVMIIVNEVLKDRAAVRGDIEPCDCGCHSAPVVVDWRRNQPYQLCCPCRGRIRWWIRYDVIDRLMAKLGR